MSNKRPFWSIEFDYLKERRQFESDCRYSKNLLEALMTGANSIRLEGKNIGYMSEDHKFNINEEPFSEMDEDQLEEIKVTFDCLDTDEDGFTIALFDIATSVDKSLWSKRGYDIAVGWLEKIND